MVALLTGGVVGAAAASTTSGEGPLPWKYPGSGSVAIGSGTTVSGTPCTSGAPQFASPYAPPCIGAFKGNNGGATSNGVTATTITLAQREFPSTANTQQVAAQAKNAGAALPEVTNQVQQVFLDYFNKVFNLYGRHVVLQKVTGAGDATTESLGQGQAQACADADNIANQMHAFGEVGFTFSDTFVSGGTGPFAQCAAQQKLVEFNGNAYFDEGTFQQQNPYVWNTAMNCDRIANQTAEAFDKLLVGKPAIYAGDPGLKTKVRRFGTYLPNLAPYIRCNGSTTSGFAQVMAKKFHVPSSTFNSTFRYDLDISTFNQSAQQAILQFKAAGVTTVVLACDPFSAMDLTKAAAAQNYHPEWLLNGAGLTDLDQSAQTYDQSEVTGHLFGLSQLSPSVDTSGPNSIAGKLYQKLTGHPIPPGTDGNYGQLIEVFDLLQAAGPNLTPANLARGTHALPIIGGPAYEYGRWDFRSSPTGAPTGDHTAVSDARFIYWDGAMTSPLNGSQGTYIQVFNGKRYSLGDWPTSLPTLFTGS
ncbi:MAG TPA: hypothetical protein VGU73_00305 [Acidimicrobiia bacterium]|nr:hypothetical protein [Acidimicrobiia bacterium]